MAMGNLIPVLFQAFHLFSLCVFQQDSACVIYTFHRYNSATGAFTVPPGGDGLYYFSTYLLTYFGEYGLFTIRVNGANLCTAFGDNSYNGDDVQQATCSGLAQLSEGTSDLGVVSFGADAWYSLTLRRLLSAKQFFVLENTRQPCQEKKLAPVPTGQNCMRPQFHLVSPSTSVAGDVVSVVYDEGTDTTPLNLSSARFYNGFSGFRL